jgi:hypothetical protein
LIFASLRRLRRGLSFRGKHSSLGEVIPFEVRNGASIYRGRVLGRVEDLPLFPGAQPAFPRHCSMQGKELEAVEVKTVQEPDPEWVNHS